MLEYGKEYYEKYHGISYNPIRVIKRYSIPKNYKILVVPCGDGKYIVNMRKCGWNVYGADINRYALAQSDSKYRIKYLFEQDIRNMNLIDSNSFDLVISRYLLEHFIEEDVVKALKELHRVSRNLVYIGVTTVDVKPERIKQDPTHKLFLTYSEWERLILSSNLFTLLKKNRQKEEWLFKVIK